jgi:PAS domain S-box-containing protein
MKVSLERKIFAGYIINMIVVIAIGLIYWRQLPFIESTLWHWVSIVLIVMSLGMLTVVYFILKTQLKARKKTSEALFKNEKLLHSMINNTGNAISVKKINGEYILVNKLYQSLFASKEKNLIGKTNYDFLSKEIADTYHKGDIEVIKAQKDIQIEEILETTEGKHIYLSVKFPLFDTLNRVYAIGNISTDITERKKLTESLKAADSFFNLSFDSLIVASEHSFIKINASLGKTLGYTDEELLSKPFSAFIHSEDVAMTQQKIANLKEGTNLVNFRNRWVCKDGAIKWLSWNATGDKSSGHLYAIARDITEKLRLEEEEQKAIDELYESQQKLHIILENISDGVLVANPKKEVVLANYMVHELFGTEEEVNMSANFSDHFNILFPDGKKTFPVQDLPSERALNGEIVDDVEVILEDLQTHKKRSVLLSGRPILDTKNNVIAAVITITDIGKYKKMEEKLKKTELEYRKLIGFKNN